MGRYSIRLLTTDNIAICKRKDFNQSQFESCTYVFVEKSNRQTNLGWNIIISGDIKYIGSDAKFDTNKLFSNRPFVHSNKDLLTKVITKKYICYCILGLSQPEARCLEALFIRQTKKPLSKRRATTLESGCLINKRFEHKWERLCNKYLNLETQWK